MKYEQKNSGMCRLLSILFISMIGLSVHIPNVIIGPCLVYELIFPTLGDDDCTLICDADPVEPMHPGYLGHTKRFDAPLQMAPAGLCLYHCHVAGTDLAKYQAQSVPERDARAEELRSATIAQLRQHGASKPADR